MVAGEFKRNQKPIDWVNCSVPGCVNHADFEVFLYDYYSPPINEEFFKQDYTCPFICESHMIENEQKAIGLRKPRGIVTYPYTNRHFAQGYTKYQPISKQHLELLDESRKLMIPEVRLDIIDTNEELIKLLSRKPELLRETRPRKFEEIVAELWKDKGYEVMLTQRTRDGGKDIYAVHKDSFGSLLYVIECKRYASSNKVGVEAVRGLYGVKMAERASMGILVTTSSFTRDALEFANPLKYELSLKDYEDLMSWILEYKKARNVTFTALNEKPSDIIEW
jgi:hypothetical protein